MSKMGDMLIEAADHVHGRPVCPNIEQGMENVCPRCEAYVNGVGAGKIALLREMEQIGQIDAAMERGDIMAKCVLLAQIKAPEACQIIADNIMNAVVMSLGAKPMENYDLMDALIMLKRETTCGTCKCVTPREVLCRDGDRMICRGCWEERRANEQETGR